MKRILENFEHLHFTESRLGSPVVEGRTMRVPVHNLLPMMGHPLMTNGVQLITGTLVFHGVSKSRRSLTEYVGNPKNPEGFKDEYSVEDLPSLTDEFGFHRAYLFEGVYENPVAWVDWDVLAESFELIVDE
jgi:hypothetical protein